MRSVEPAPIWSMKSMAPCTTTVEYDLFIYLANNFAESHLFEPHSTVQSTSCCSEIERTHTLNKFYDNEIAQTLILNDTTMDFATVLQYPGKSCMAVSFS